MKKSKGTIRKGAVGAALGAAAGSPLGPAGMVGGAALGSKLGGKKKEAAPAPAPAPVQNSRGRKSVRKQPSEPPHGPTTPMMPSGSLGMGKGDKPVQKLLPALAAGAIGGKLLGLSDDKPIQKLLPALAAGAIGGKLLGLSKKNDVPVQKIIGGLISGLGQAAGGAVSSIGLSKKKGVPVQKVIGSTVSSVGQTAGNLVGDILSQDDSEEIEKHRGKSFHSHKRKNPLLRRRNR